MFFDYLRSVLSSIPTFVYNLFGIISIVGTLMITYFSNNRKQYLALLYLLLYISFLYMGTVLFRDKPLFGGIKLCPFWSYCELNNDPSLVIENFMNVMAFLPVGFLLFGYLNHINWKIVLVIGFAFSLSIELLQLMFDKGLCEIDDVIHNTLGCLIGAAMFVACFRITKWISRR